MTSRSPTMYELDKLLERLDRYGETPLEEACSPGDWHVGRREIVTKWLEEFSG